MPETCQDLSLECTIYSGAAHLASFWGTVCARGFSFRPGTSQDAVIYQHISAQHSSIDSPLFCYPLASCYSTYNTAVIQAAYTLLHLPLDFSCVSCFRASHNYCLNQTCKHLDGALKDWKKRLAGECLEKTGAVFVLLLFPLSPDS